MSCFQPPVTITAILWVHRCKSPVFNDVRTQRPERPSTCSSSSQTLRPRHLHRFAAFALPAERPFNLFSLIAPVNHMVPTQRTFLGFRPVDACPRQVYSETRLVAGHILGFFAAKP